MMNEFKIGGFAISQAGHDSGKYYVIFHMDSEYVYLVDGKIRTLDRPKKKKLKHVIILEELNQSLIDKVMSRTVRNEEIKREIKLMQSRNSSKEANNVKDRCC